ncbi:hypothetical protein [Roseicyclus persicicus]|uniref:Roadblock/LC7 domain-containing protein n=1 Tax=Roseicyclus persicicus TaxID=2650661 RepID=A0A7X6GXX5_9RHOB|nr:hypothetical protein [Roseibacterium persicicum]NKX44435.1 hypothetical protein [Roseibacterium persicicum]
MTPDTLARLRRAVPACSLVVWADIDKGTVLAADGDLAYPQEHLDALGACAAQLLEVAAPGSGRQPDSALFAGPTGCRVFFRVPGAPAEAICCLGGPVADPPALLDRLRGALAAAPHPEAAA